MNRIKWMMVMAILATTIKAQVTVKVVIDKLPEQPVTDAIFIAGNFNEWNPGNTTFQLQQQPNGTWTNSFAVPANTALAFKFTRGSWDKAEATATGGDTENRAVKITKDTTIRFKITAWRDAFPQGDRHSTAASNVQLLDSAFYLKALGRKRRIWIYLPKDYNDTKKHYPVLYMHDGQNLFDAATASFGEWDIDSVLNRYFDETGKSCIVIGIDNGPKRLTEYNPYNNKQNGRGEGKQYIQSIVEDLKPFIDKKYRTLKTAKDTWMAGSSMGGLITMTAVMAYPKVFGKAGILSPAFWAAPQLKKDVKTMLKDYNGELFFYGGEKENASMVPEIDSVIAAVKSVSKAKIVREINPDGQHNEHNWNAVFPAFLRLLFKPFVSKKPKA